ncbi:hypothetical protein JTB14_000759 [Gonioctena quinquepunctata]|nr:hypothetical protein JTB14_000759 [Gonioctena quinquepunctata]
MWHRDSVNTQYYMDSCSEKCDSNKKGLMEQQPVSLPGSHLLLNRALNVIQLNPAFLQPEIECGPSSYANIIPDLFLVAAQHRATPVNNVINTHQEMVQWCCAECAVDGFAWCFNVSPLYVY